MDKTQQLASAPVGKLMLKFYFPALIGIVANALYNIVDRIFIGRYIGTSALAGVTATFPLMLVIIAFGMMIGIGSGVLVSIKLGEQKREEAEQVLGNNLFMVAGISMILIPVLFFLQHYFLRLFGATNTTLQYAVDYFSIIIFGIVFSTSGFSMNNIIRSEGSANIAMVSMIISSVANIFLDWLFIVKFGWGIKGAAYATIISMFLLSLWVIIHFKSNRSVIKLRLGNIRPRWTIIRPAVAIGMAPFAMQMASSVVQALFNRKLVKYGGDNAVGAMGVIVSIISLLLMAVFALNMAAQPIIGYNFGAKVYSRVKRSLGIALFWATVISIFSFFVFQIFPEPIVRLFNSDDIEFTKMASNGLRITSLAFPIVGFQIINGNYFQAVGKARLSLLLTLLRQVVFLIPLLLILPNYLALDGLWYAMPISDALSAIVSFILLVMEWKKLSKESML